MTEQQKQIIESLVNEFEKMNKPTSSNKAGLVDWNKLNEAKDKWLKTKREVEVSNEAMRKLILQTVDNTNVKIHKSLGDVFEIKSRYFTEVDNGYLWEFWAVKEPSRVKHEAFRVTLDVKRSDRYSECRNFYVKVIESIHFHTYAGNEHGALITDTIEELFQHERVINTIMKYL
jgi:hypothetical protein